MRWSAALPLLFLLVAGCTGSDDLGDWKVTSVVHGSLTPPTDCPDQAQLQEGHQQGDDPGGLTWPRASDARTHTGGEGGSRPFYPDMLAFHRHAVMYLMVSEHEFPFEHSRTPTVPPTGGVHMHGNDATFHWHGICVPLDEALALHDVHVTASSLRLGASHGGFAGEHGPPVIAVNLWQDERLIVVENVDDYLRSQPHDGSRVLIATQDMAQRLLDMADDVPGFKREDRPLSPPSGGEA